MARIRLQYDLANGPYYMCLDGDGIPSNSVPTAKVLNIGLGTGSTQVLATTSGNIVDIRGKFTQTSGEGRCIYSRLYLHGSIGGDCLRAYTNVNANLDTARGAHISLDFVNTADGSECSGLGTALTCTLHIPNVAAWNPSGTYASILAEINSDGANSDPAGMSELSFIQISNSGNATGKADVDTDAYLFSIQGFTAAADTTKLLSSKSLAELPANSVALRIKIGATIYYMLAVLATELN